VGFNADGTISNYMEVFAARQNYVNSLINNYNSMSAEEQESYKDVVEQAKEDFKEFQKDLDRYDTLVSNEIPGLSQSIQDALDKQIELNVKKFNLEVTITLDMAEAERDWNK
jgi:multidrug resistance efflux pump